MTPRLERKMYELRNAMKGFEIARIILCDLRKGKGMRDIKLNR
jgi:hypothetical protein